MKTYKKAARSGTANQNKHIRNNIDNVLRFQPPSASDYLIYNQLKADFLRDNPTANHEEYQRASIRFAKLVGV